MRTFRYETGLYLLAFVIALAVRLVGLGALPLSDQEAQWALQALDISKGTPISLGSQPAYVVLTSALFFLFGGATNAMARLIPALTGSAMVLVPALFRGRLKPRPAVILAFLIALEPGLTAISRQAGSSIMAVTLMPAAIGFWDTRRPHLAGICAALAILSGPALWVGMLGLGITWALMRPFERSRQPEPKKRASARPVITSNRWPIAGAYAVGTILAIGTLLMTVPSGLSAWIGGIPEYISGWTRASDMPIATMLGSLIGYQPLTLLLAVLAIVRGWQGGSLRIRWLSIWMLVALLLAVFYPARQVPDLAWMLIPLSALAALEAARHLNLLPLEGREALGAMVPTVVMLLFIWFNILALRRPGISPDVVTVRAWLVLGSFGLLVVTLLLVAVGWSVRIARFGAVWGLAVCLGVYSLGGLMAAAGHRTLPNSAEMWRPGAELPAADLVLKTVKQYSAWSDADPESQPVLVAGIQSPALQWLLRDRPVELREAAGAASQPPIVITSEQQDPALVAAYRGQAFNWRSTPVWAVLNFVQWLPFHEASHQHDKVILWVRNDLFPDSNPRTSP